MKRYGFKSKKRALDAHGSFYTRKPKLIERFPILQLQRTNVESATALCRRIAPDRVS